jgi:hypothetical protein
MTKDMLGSIEWIVLGLQEQSLSSAVDCDSGVVLHREWFIMRPNGRLLSPDGQEGAEQETAHAYVLEEHIVRVQGMSASLALMPVFIQKERMPSCAALGRLRTYRGYLRLRHRNSRAAPGAAPNSDKVLDVDRERLTRHSLVSCAIIVCPLRADYRGRVHVWKRPSAKWCKKRPDTSLYHLPELFLYL